MSLKKILFLFCLLSQNIFAEDKIVIIAQIKDIYGGVISFPGIRVVNAKKSLQGNQLGVFRVEMQRSDTLLIYARDFATIKYTIPDSIKTSEYYTQIVLRPIEYELEEVTIYDTKPLYEIKNEIKKVQYHNPNSYKYVKPSSPITMLYEYFSKKERDKRLVASMEYDMELRNIYKDLVKYYITEGVLKDMHKNEFTSFINFLNISEQYLKGASDYDLAIVLKAKQFEYFNLKK